MRTAIFSDIHANLEALEAVRRAGAQRGVDRWVCLGDLVGYGADPAACLEQTRQLTDMVVMGNHDQAVTGLSGLEHFNPYARQAIEWTAAQLSSEEKAYLTELPLAIEEGEAFYVHAHPADPEGWGYVQSLQDVREALAAIDTRLCFIGHSHQPFACGVDQGPLPLDRAIELLPQRRYLVNAGSVGQPRDGDWRACFLIWDEARGTLDFVRADYDLEAAQAKILGAGLPGFLARRLGRGF